MRFLKSEWDQCHPATQWVNRLVVDPDIDIDSHTENHWGASLVPVVRGSLLQRLPPDAARFKVSSLGHEHLDEPRLSMPCYGGLSTSPCHWYLADWFANGQGGDA